jgi:hypothetical protein
MSGEPRRWVDDPSVPQRLRDDLRNAAGAAPPGFDANAGLERLRAALDGGASGLGATSATASVTAAATVPTWLWGALATLVAATGVGVGVWLATSPGAHDAAKPPEVSAPAVSSGDPPGVTGPPGEAHPDLPPPPSAETTAGAAEGPSAPASPEGTADLLRREIAAVARARAQLEAQPAEALALLERTHRDIGAGILGEEREVLTVLALHRLGRKDAMRQRGRRFLQHHPDSPFAARVRAVLDE